jgi:hypothetical protein
MGYIKYSKLMEKEKKYKISLKRTDLVRQLIRAAHLVKFSEEKIVEFDIFQTTFKVEVDE